MAGRGASTDPAWIENELYMLEKTLGMYKVYAANAQGKAEKKTWDERLHGIEHHIEEVKLKLEKARKLAGVK